MQVRVIYLLREVVIVENLVQLAKNARFTIRGGLVECILVIDDELWRPCRRNKFNCLFS